MSGVQLTGGNKPNIITISIEKMNLKIIIMRRYCDINKIIE